MTGYTDTILRYAADATRAGKLAHADGTGEVGLGAEEAGRRLAVRFALRLRDGRAETVRFQVFGCGFTIAACAAAAELAEGRSLAEITAIGAAEIDARLAGLPAERGYCAELAAEALQAAVTSARDVSHAVHAVVHDPAAEHAPRVSAADPVYRRLMGIKAPAGVLPEDRHLFACLLAVAAAEPYELAAAVGLPEAELATLLAAFFPGVGPDELQPDGTKQARPPESNDGVLALLLGYVPLDAAGSPRPAALWLARAIAARAAHPGHLWRAMGLFTRPELTAAIRRHLPALAAANNRNMRWKRFLFRQVCELRGGLLCKSPDCGVCSDYPLCFASEE